MLAILGLSAWFCFRQLKLSPLACLLGGLAAVLNTSYFSVVCWGVGAHAVAAGTTFLAIGLLSDVKSRLRWLKVLLAGFAVGMGIMEGADLGAIYSLLVGAFVGYQAIVAEGSAAARVAMGAVRLALVVVCAAALSFQALTALIGTQIKGVAVTQQEERTKEERWDWATQWSLPKREALSLVVPGVFGYRLDSPKGAAYWGAAGRDPAWDRYFASDRQGPAPRGFLRHTGGGSYLGVLVVLIAVWAAVQALRKQNSLFPLDQRKHVWFWSVAAIVCLITAFGRHAPLYQFLFALPYASTIRNPAKFLHLVSFSFIMLFGFGVHALSRRYIVSTANTGAASSAGKPSAFDRKWMIGCGIAFGVSILAWLIYSASRTSLERYLQSVFFEPEVARQIAGYSLGRVGWFILLLGAAMGLVAMILRGRFTGQRATWAGVLLGLFLCIDLGLANTPWIRYWNWREKYATNPLIEMLREKPYEKRVAIFEMDRFINLDRLPPEARPIIQLNQQLSGIYRIEWAQHHFQYFNIQSLDIVQMPRMPTDLKNFESVLLGSPVRRWELTNTRFLLAPFALTEFLNQQLDPVEKRFRVHTRFDITPKPGEVNLTSYEQFTAVLNTNGNFALIEFTGALPRAALYANWQAPGSDPAMLNELKSGSINTNEIPFLQQVGTNDFLTIKQLTSPTFDPKRTVLLAQPLPNTPPAGDTNRSAGNVEFVSYAPKRIALKAKAETASVLLLNDKFDPNWKVKVDGKPQELLRCNYIMRGVQVPAGEHQVEFRYAPSLTGVYVSLGAIVIAIALAGFTFFGPIKPEPVTTPPGPEPAPRPKEAKAQAKPGLVEQPSKKG